MGAAGIFLGLGTNIGDRKQNLLDCLEALGATVQVKILRTSSIYETEPVGVSEQPDFLNMVVEIETSLPPRELLLFVKGLEQKLGRVKSRRWGPRLIDIDILAYRDIIVEEADLEIPHRQLSQRLFVLVPLQEIAPEFRHPVTKSTVKELIAECQDIKQVHLIRNNSEIERKLQWEKRNRS